MFNQLKCCQRVSSVWVLPGCRRKVWHHPKITRKKDLKTGMSRCGTFFSWWCKFGSCQKWNVMMWLVTQCCCRSCHLMLCMTTEACICLGLDHTTIQSDRVVLCFLTIVLLSLLETGVVPDSGLHRFVLTSLVNDPIDCNDVLELLTQLQCLC